MACPCEVVSRAYLALRVGESVAYPVYSGSISSPYIQLARDERMIREPVQLALCMNTAWLVLVMVLTKLYESCSDVIIHRTMQLDALQLRDGLFGFLGKHVRGRGVIS